jgi:hypothetical protein
MAPHTLLICALLAILCLSSCSSTHTSTSVSTSKGTLGSIKSTLFSVDKSPIEGDDRKLASFNQIDATGRGNFVLTVAPGTTQLVRVEANGKSLKGITTRVENGVLKIALEPGTNPEAMRVVVNTASLDKLALGGAFHAIVNLVSPVAHDMSVNGATNMTLTGKVQKLKLTINGASSVVARELKSENCDVTVGGASSADLDGTATITVNAGGASHATLYTGGKPGKITQVASGAARVDINSETIY